MTNYSYLFHKRVSFKKQEWWKIPPTPLLYWQDRNFNRLYGNYRVGWFFFLFFFEKNKRISPFIREVRVPTYVYPFFPMYMFNFHLLKMQVHRHCSCTYIFVRYFVKHAHYIISWIEIDICTISSSVSHFEIFFLPWILSTLISKCLISDNQQIKIQKRKGQRAICCLIRWQELNNKMLFVLSLRHQDQPNILVSLIVPDFTLPLSLI